ncbi:MAG: hypothetical protein RIQ93_290 [Verrucomicrobiota bacterium]
MSQTAAGRHRVEEHFSLPLFLFTVAASFACLGALLKFAAPAFVWEAQVSMTFWSFSLVFLAVTMFNCFMEWGFHRYVLHKPVIPLLSRFYKQHTLHHNLTRIGRRRTPGGREVPFVENIYPITEPEQGEASFFPWYTLAVFSLALTPLLVLAQAIAPGLPWFFGGYTAVASSLLIYELFHAVEHWSFERWSPMIEHARFGWLWRKVYSFHLRHHAVIDCNEAISGFFTLPVADWVLGTFILPKTLYTGGTEWTPAEFVSPRPCALVRWCDAKSEQIVRERRAEASDKSSAAPVSYTRGEQVAHYFTHGLGMAGSITALILLASAATAYGGTARVASGLIFGVTLVLGYVAFINFRNTRVGGNRPPFTRRNHVAVFLLIGGTATPFLLVGLQGAWGWTLFGVVWGLCVLGALVRLFCTGRLQTMSSVAYVLVGLVPFVAIKPLIAALPHGALWLLFAGVCCYVCGTVFHLWQQMRYHQVLRHLFAFGGTACHLVAVLLFVLPAH